MALFSTPDQFAAHYDGKLINNGGIQCVAVANQYNRDFVEGGWIGTPLTGYAIDWWTNFGNDADYNNYVKVGADQPAQSGDIAIWKVYPTSKLPHIALALRDNGNGTIKCLSQNPGVAKITSLTKQGLVGYLRPKKLIKASPAPAQKAVTADVVAAVKRGDYGNEPQRSINLRNAGYDPVAVQAAVNASMGSAPAPAPAVNRDNGATFTVAQPMPGYVTSADAKNGHNSNSTVPAGTYSVFNRANGAINITRQAGVPGWWVKP